MDMPVPTSSRRALLRVLTAAPIGALAMPVISPWSDALAALHEEYADPPVTLLRTGVGRRLSRMRYHRAEAFFPASGPRWEWRWHDFLYHAGITVQLGLSSHLLDMGFADPWCARHIGLHVAKALAYANATGFGHDCPDMARLTAILSPYWKWNRVRLFGEPKPDDGGFTPEEVRPLLRALLERVYHGTGHPRPPGWHRRLEQREAML